MQEILRKYFLQKYKTNIENDDDFKSMNASQISPEIKERYSTILLMLNKLIKKCRKGEIINLKRLYEKVAACGISAIGSIPIALFSFMIATDPHCRNEVNNKLNTKDAFKEYPHPVERVIFYAISFGGESNKIASMAGAIAGAFFSRLDLPKYLVEMCESHREIETNAQKLFELSLGRNLNELKRNASIENDNHHESSENLQQKIS
jgi:ADP-ribosylglycohydrolase